MFKNLLSVEDVHRCTHRLAPVRARHAHAFQQAACHLHHGLVPALDDTILLRRVRRRRVPEYAQLLTVSGELV